MRHGTRLCIACMGGAGRGVMGVEGPVDGGGARSHKQLMAVRTNTSAVSICCGFLIPG